MAHQNGLFEIEARLAQWAFYKIALLEGGIGWPSKNLIISLTEGVAGARFPPTSSCLILKFDYSQQTDGWVRAMGKQLPYLEDAITLYYTNKLPVGEVAKIIGVSRRTFLTRVHDAKIWLLARLSALIEAQEKEAKQKLTDSNQHWLSAKVL